MAQKPFQSVVQDMVYNIEVGIGMRLIRRILYVFFVVAIMLLYTATQFRGLDNAQAMDMAQLGRNVAAGAGYKTLSIRPLSIWMMTSKQVSYDLRSRYHPDPLNPPLYPLMLAAGFAVNRTAATATPDRGIFSPEQWVVIPLNHLFVLLTGLLVYGLGRRLFEARIGLLGMTIYYLSTLAWGDSIQGTGLPLLYFLGTASFYCALAAADHLRRGDRFIQWLIPYVGSLALAALAFYTRYTAAAILPGLLLLLGLGFRRRAGPWLAAYVLGYLALLAPWLVYTRMQTGSFLGIAPYLVLDGTKGFEDGALFRTLNLEVSALKALGAVREKWFANLGLFARHYFPDWGGGLLGALFTASFFFPFVREDVRMLKWSAGLSMLCLTLTAAAVGESHLQYLHLFWPIILVYGLAFYHVLLNRLDLPTRLHEISLTTLVVLISAGPLFFTIAPPRARMPYPPYYPPHISFVSRMLEPDEALCTDMPWATAWYGERTSVEMPASLDGFFEINDYIHRFSGLYMTPVSRNLPYIDTLRTGPYKSWFPIMEGRLPPDFPLTKGFPLNNMDQLFLTDYARWR